jgi:hypothetical protein
MLFKYTRIVRRDVKCWVLHNPHGEDTVISQVPHLGREYYISCGGNMVTRRGDFQTFKTLRLAKNIAEKLHRSQMARGRSGSRRRRAIPRTASAPRYVGRE